MTPSTEIFKAGLNHLLDSTRAFITTHMKVDEELAYQSDVIIHRINELRKQINAVVDADMKD
jgi:hypothetical protein